MDAGPLTCCDCGKPALGRCGKCKCGKTKTHALCSPCAEKEYAAAPFPCDDHKGKPCGPGMHLALPPMLCTCAERPGGRMARKEASH